MKEITTLVRQISEPPPDPFDAFDVERHENLQWKAIRELYAKHRHVPEIRDYFIAANRNGAMVGEVPSAILNHAVMCARQLLQTLQHEEAELSQQSPKQRWQREQSENDPFLQDALIDQRFLANVAPENEPEIGIDKRGNISD